jgi:hypothetical protein
MKYFFIIIFYLSSSFLFLSCADDKTINDEEKFAKVYVDLLINEEQNHSDSLKIKSGRDNIFKKYGITQNQYEATINYYNEDPERWREFFVKVNDYFGKIEIKPKSR